MLQRAQYFAGLLVVVFIVIVPAFSQQRAQESEDNWQLDQSFGFPFWIVANDCIGTLDSGYRHIYLFIEEQNFSEQNIRKVFTGLAARYKTPQQLYLYAHSNRYDVERALLSRAGFTSFATEDSLQGRRAVRNRSVGSNLFRSGCYRAWYLRGLNNREEINYSPDPEREYLKKIDLKHPQVTYSGDAHKDLFTSIQHEDLEKITALLESGIDINHADFYGNTPLMKAAANGNAGMVRLFLDKGADVKFCNKAGVNALMLASIDGAPSVVELLLDKGADIDAATNMDKDGLGDTALMAAALHGHLKTVQALLARGAQVDARNGLGETALMQAAAGGNLETVQFLLACGADVNARDNYGETSLMLAYQAPEIVKALLAAGADFTVNENGMTALMLAARYYQKTMQVLIESGAGKESIKVCQAWIDSPPKTKDADSAHLKELGYQMLSTIYLKLGRNQEAIKTHQQAIIDLGDKPYLRTRLGFTYLEAGDRKGAIKQYRILQKGFMNAVDADTKRLYFGWADALFKALQQKD